MRSAPSRMLLLSFLVALLLLWTPAGAFPFGPSSAVTELTPATLPAFVNTHKPVVILFYAPWCGHCKRFHPEIERFAESVKGTMRVGAIDADQHASIGQQYGVRGFPTIKYWKMGTKSIASPQEYQGQRTAAALQSFMVADITAAHVKTVMTTEQLKQAVRKAPERKVGVLFSAKDKVPPMLSVMALSPKLKSFPLTFVGGCVPDKGVALSFEVTQVPTLGVLQYTPAAGSEEERFELVPYTKSVIAYEPVAHFFLDCVERECGSAGTGKGAAPASADAAAATTADAEEGEAGNEKGGRQHERHRGSHVHGHHTSYHLRHSAVALPVEPVPFTNDTIANFCSPQALKIRGRSPMCVISLTEHVSLSTLHQQFQNDPFVFFDAAQHRVDVIQQFQDKFGVVLDTDATTDAGAVVLLRQGRPTQMRHILLQDVNSDSDLKKALQQVLNGELRLDKTHIDGGGVEDMQRDD
jgi:protein disulfide-isomerase-like protein